ncbi:MAG: thioredoxin [Nitrospirota bacterium]|nr:thioredoxin [Nitrospirota bacterium]
MGAVAVNSAEFESEVLQADTLVMVDFWAPWCGPCKMIAPTVEALAEEYAGRCKVVKVNTDENQDVATRYQVMGIPTLLFIKGGQPVDKVVGAASSQQLKDKIEAHL